MSGTKKHSLPKEIFTACIYVATLAIVCLFWKTPFIAAMLLLILHIVLLYAYRNTMYVGIYFFAFVCGPATEAVAIAMGAWQYSLPSFFGIPIWLPFVWGSAGVMFLRTGIFIQKKYEKTN